MGKLGLVEARVLASPVSILQKVFYCYRHYYPFGYPVVTKRLQTEIRTRDCKDSAKLNQGAEETNRS